MLSEILFMFGTLFPVVNPLSTVLIFNKLTRTYSHQARKKIALATSMAAFIAMILFMILGQALLEFFGVTFYAFRIAGGIYLSYIGFRMLAPQLRRDPKDYVREGDNIAVIPLAIPLLAGPGSLTTVLVLTAASTMLYVAIAIMIVCLLSWLVLRQATLLERIMGHTGASVIERILGIIVLTLAIQFVFDGISGYLSTLH